MKVRRTRKSMEYINAWDRGSVPLAVPEMEMAGLGSRSRIEDAEPAAAEVRKPRTRRVRRNKRKSPARSERRAADRNPEASRHLKRKRKATKRKAGLGKQVVSEIPAGLLIPMVLLF